MPPRTRSQKADLEERGLTASPLQQLPNTTRVRRQPRTRTNKSNSLPLNHRVQASQNPENQSKTTPAQQQQLEENIENVTVTGRGSDSPKDNCESPSSLTQVAHPVQDPFPPALTLQKAEAAPERPLSGEAASAAKDEDKSMDAPFDTPSASLQQAQSEPSDVKSPSSPKMPYAPINVESALQSAPHALIHLCLKAPAMSNLELEYPAAKPDAVYMVPTKYLDWVFDQISNVPGAYVLRNPLTVYYIDPVISPQAPLGAKKRKADGDVEMAPPAQRPRLNQSIVRERLRRQMNRERLSKPRADQVYWGDLPTEPLGPGVGAVRPRFVINEYDEGGGVELGLTPPIHESETADGHKDRALQPALGSGTTIQPTQPLASSISPSANVNDDSVDVHPPPSDPTPMSGQPPQTPSRSWGLESILGTARSITKLFPSRRNNESQTATASQDNQARLAATQSISSDGPQTEPRQVQPLTEIANAPATTQPARSLHNKASDQPRLMRTKGALKNLKKQKALQNELQEQLKQIEKEKEWLEKERRDLDRAHRAAYEAQKPGEKRIRLPSPEMIPRAENGGFTTDSNYFAYDSSDDEESPSQFRPKKVRRVSNSNSSSQSPLASSSKAGELNQPLPYTGRHFSDMKKNAFSTSRTGSFWREMEKQRKIDERKAAKMAEAEKRGPKPSFYVPGWGIGGDTSSSEDENEEEDSEELTIEASKSNQTPQTTAKPSLSGTSETEKLAQSMSKSASRPGATSKDPPKSSSTQRVAAPSTPITQAPSTTSTVQAPATAPVPKMQNTWTQPPPPPPNPSHAALPSTSGIIEPDSIRIQRAKFQKPPTKPSSLRYSSRVSTSTVGSDDGDDESRDQDDRAAKEPATAAEVNQPLGAEREKADKTLIDPPAQNDTPSQTDPPTQSNLHAQTPAQEGARSDISELGKTTPLIPIAYEEFKENVEPKVLEFLESNWDQMDEVFAHEDFSRLFDKHIATTQTVETGNDAEESLFLSEGPASPVIKPTSANASLSSTRQTHTEEGVMDAAVQNYLDETWTQKDEAWAINDFRQGLAAFKKNMSAVNQLA
ncbi:MAG: hypothetical protein LQ342_007411 [Letrouitia transgressa]|nr:MAG: hypothetical protein LQ342_007411 [Letrouitia transgressa]